MIFHPHYCYDCNAQYIGAKRLERCRWCGGWNVINWAKERMVKMKLIVKCFECNKELDVANTSSMLSDEITIFVKPCKECIDEIAEDNKSEIDSYREETNELYKEIATLKEELKKWQENAPQES